MDSRATLTCIVALALLVAGCEWRSAPAKPPVVADKILDVPDLHPVLTAMALSADGSMVAIGDAEGEIVLREVPSGAERWRDKLSYSGQVGRLIFSADGSLLGVVTSASSFLVRRTSTGEIIRSMGAGGARSIALHPTDATLATGQGENLIFLGVEDAEAPKYLTRAFPGERIDDVAFSSDGRLLVAVSALGTVKAWTWPELAPRLSLKLPKSPEAIEPVSLALSVQDKRAAVNGRGGRVHVIDLVNQREERTFDNTPTAPGHGTHSEIRASLAFTLEGNWLFAPDLHDRGLRILDLTSGKTHAVLHGDAPFYTAMSISVPASLVALLRVGDVQGRWPYGLEVWRLTYQTP